MPVDTLGTLVARLCGPVREFRRLDGEHDWNVAVTLSSGERRLLKIHRRDAAIDELDLQDDVLRHLAGGGSSLLQHRTVLSPADGEPLDGRVARLLDWTEGEPWSALYRGDVVPSEATLFELGRTIARLDRALLGFSHPGLDRRLRWNMLQATQLPEPSDRWAADMLQHFGTDVAPSLHRLPMQAIHNDANENNIVVRRDVNTGAGAADTLTLIDFGDVIRAPRIVGLAVGVTYAMFGHRDPLHGALPVVAGYHDEVALLPDELALLDDLIRTRLAMSIANAETQVRENPGNAAYLSTSQDAVQLVVTRLDTIERQYAHFAFRNACGLRAVPSGRTVTDYFGSAAFDPAPIVDCDLGAAKVMDYSTDAMSGSATLTADPDGAALGRYREERSIYDMEAFSTPSGERRTVHLGIDVMVRAGTVIRAPLDGTIFASEIRPERGDYGGVIMLEHRTPSGVPFWLLLGHLSHSSVAANPVGRHFDRGEPIAWVGDRGENGGWSPHIHAHLYVDTLGRSTDLPGVVRRSQLDVWDQIAPNPAPLLKGVDANSVEVPRPESTTSLRQKRRTAMSTSLSLSYRQPLQIVHGDGASLIDADGNRWLDLVNNVAHVGHEHPTVVGAITRQVAALNTNTRYLHELPVAYAERLRALLPDPLSVVFFTNSGSEANDLALRIARTATGSEGVLTLDWGYHGNLSTLIDVSPYKFNRKGGRGVKPWVRIAELPDPYRGRFADDGVAYADSARIGAALLRDSSSGFAAFVHESISGCGGQVDLASGYLPAAYAAVRDAGGICIADEVQTGLGRVGSEWWAFERHGVVPDIVTMGKPLGNGHPLGVVVTTAELARAFRNGMEYFNTFGGNPVSCAAGLAVLDVVDAERLRANAEIVGVHMKRGLAELMAGHDCIGDVRGRGLFLGVDLVADRRTKAPATEFTSKVVEGMKSRGILVSSDGPADNVLKIKPPMVLTVAEADRVVVALNDTLHSLC